MRQPDQFDMQGRTAIKNVDPCSRHSILFPFPPLVHFHPHGRAIAHVGLKRKSDTNLKNEKKLPTWD